jgi:hypothetical protein
MNGGNFLVVLVFDRDFQHEMQMLFRPYDVTLNGSAHTTIPDWSPET